MGSETMKERSLKVAIAERECLTVNVKVHPLEPFRHFLTSKNAINSKKLRNIPNGRHVKIPGRIILVHTPPTRSGKRIMFITAEDELGLIDLVLFPDAQKKYAKIILANSLCLFEGAVKRIGERTCCVVISKAVPLVMDKNMTCRSCDTL
ncbi:OB-fold nucleic acid binding domain-containing protein [Thermodesulforhabdus norvegica]|uniref:OB-fold nucleic acid binding domain-containing protein n=1 Tax=Thermodesulforhabdus norvegica TaxID=39841 RepID=A0A1I4VDD8_9BACT|nr:OB-fold nucleic acid binding domain-containing protein [Thermodesulforhabdus norvegica]SFM99193.1 OB-fold nucleic acid binding domain-containing protein [Thermodesulforhabdus norvegica]